MQTEEEAAEEEGNKPKQNLVTKTKQTNAMKIKQQRA